MSARAAGIGVVIGAAVGALVPVRSVDPVAALAPRGDPSTPPDARANERSKPATPSCPSLDDREDLVAELAAFENAWGTPMEPPPGWDPVAREAHLRAAIESLGDVALLSAVSCELYPCVAVVVSREVFADGALNQTFGVPVGCVGQAEAQNDDPPSSIWTATITDLPERPDDEARRRYTTRLANRLANELWPETEALLDP